MESLVLGHRHREIGPSNPQSIQLIGMILLLLGPHRGDLTKIRRLKLITKGQKRSAGRQLPDYSSPSLSQLRLSRYWLWPVPGREEMPEALQEQSQNCVWIQPVPRLKLNRIQFTVYFHILCTFLKLTSYFLKDGRMQRLKMALEICRVDAG